MSNDREAHDTSAEIYFEETLIRIASWTVLRLPEDASSKLPSRGAAAVGGTINDLHFKTVLEPDGKGSHWFKIDESLLEEIKAEAGDTVRMNIVPSKEWPEPVIPEDFKEHLMTIPEAHSLWMKITPAARQDWIRWIRSTKNPETRKRRIKTACDKLNKGERRPCCFNRNLCTQPEVSKNGVLADPS